ncbi:hypothetical protein GCM10011359_02270 [Nesterenkonia alkaliphila]|nr:hypothetical protein GCM10011359_02270 [Nesterenkonia alkaliphila]
MDSASRAQSDLPSSTNGEYEAAWLSAGGEPAQGAVPEISGGTGTGEVGVV